MAANRNPALLESPYAIFSVWISVKSSLLFVGVSVRGVLRNYWAMLNTVTRSVLNEYYKARSTKPEDQKPKPEAQSPKPEAQSPKTEV